MEKRNSCILFSVISFLLAFNAIGLSCWYFYPRKIVPQKVCALHIPNDTFNLYACMSIDLIQDSASLHTSMIMAGVSLPPTGFDSMDIFALHSVLNYQNYTYVLNWNKELIELRHSPYLTNHIDGLYYDAKIPLFPLSKDTRTDSLHVYYIPKTHAFRAPGP